jgi:hypothetical protein
MSMAEPDRDDRQERPPRRDENSALRDSPDVVKKGGIAKEDSEIEDVSRDSFSSPIDAGDTSGPEGTKDRDS